MKAVLVTAAMSLAFCASLAQAQMFNPESVNRPGISINPQAWSRPQESNNPRPINPNEYGPSTSKDTRGYQQYLFACEEYGSCYLNGEPGFLCRTKESHGIKGVCVTR